MSAIDFITALGRLLQDGSLRDAFAKDPLSVAARLALREGDRSILVRLKPDDLEFQARVLLRKRFDKVRRVIPGTCERLGAAAWNTFHEYARTHRGEEDRSVMREAFDFVLHLKRHRPTSLCGHECNRLRFALGRKRFALHVVMDLPMRGRMRRALQVLVRPRTGCWREIVLYFSL